MHTVHCNLNNIRRRSLNRGIHRDTLPEGTLHEIARGKLRNLAPSAKHCRDIALFLRLCYQTVEITLNLRVCLKIALNIFRRFLLADGKILT